MRIFIPYLSMLALFPATWAFLTLEAYSRSGNEKLLISSVAAIFITAGMVLLDLLRGYLHLNKEE